MAKFIKVKCGKCNNEQALFSNSASKINCLICGNELTKTTGGKALINAEIIEEYD